MWSSNYEGEEEADNEMKGRICRWWDEGRRCQWRRNEEDEGGLRVSHVDCGGCYSVVSSHQGIREEEWKFESPTSVRIFNFI